MSKIDKLAILGVRSFDNTRSETIQFHTPLTLIVGYNGSGKTTIIECLKYATTGELPPNSKGGAFIHDPKLCGEKEVLAQVKLSFKSSSGAKMVATRSLQLTVKKTTRQQKTLEGQLLMIRDGERTAISSRVAELDQMLPQYLGVSSAVLESVIFCHQDESLWPMSEPSVLKKKFDEIFEALKYTKAIDNIKALRKKQNEELGKHKLKEQHAKEIKNQADKAEKRSKELSNEIEALRAEVGELHAKAKEAGDKAQDAFNHAARYTEVVESLKAALKNQEWHREHLADLSRDLKQRSESDEWLQNELDQFEERMKVHNQRQQEQVKRFEEVKRHIAQIRQNQSAKRVEIGKHEQRKATHEQKIKDRDLAIRQTAQQYRLRGYGMELDDTQINDFLEEIGRLSKEQTAKAEKARQDNIAELRKIQSVLDDLREWRSALQEKKKSAKESITGNERRIANLHVELRSITTDEGKKAIIESNIGELEGKLTQSRQEFANGTWNHKIQQITAELRNLEDQSATLNRDLIQGTKQAGNLARLNHLRKELKDRQTSLDTMKAAHGDRLRAVLGRDWKAAKLEVDFQSVLESKRGRVQEAERQRDEVNRELEQVEFKLKTAQTDMKRKRTELDRCATILKGITSGEPEEYPQVLQDLQESRDTRKDDVNGYSIMRKWFNECIETAKSDQPACRLCSRAFSDERSVRQFIKKLESKVSQGALKELQQELKEFEADLRKATNAGTTYDTWVRLSSKELPSIETEATKLDQARNGLLKRQEDHDKVISERQDDLRDVETLVKPVGNIVKYNADLESFKIQIDELVAKQEGTGSSRTLEDLQEEIEMVSSKSRSLRANQSKLQAEEQSARNQISTFEVEIGRLKNQLTTANNELEKKSRIVAQVNELRDSNTSQRDATSELDKQLQDLTPRFLEEEAKLEDVKQRGNAKEKELQGEATKLAETVRNLRRANHEIQEYIQGSGLTKLERCQREIQSFENEIVLLEEEQRQITIEVNKIKEELSSHDQNKRVINDNLRFRKTKKDLEVVNAQIEELSAQNAEADQEKWRRQAERFQRQYNLLTTEETSKMGTMKAKDDQLGGLIRDWETDYKDAEIKYKKSHIEVETSKAAVEDLGRYGSALDKAIMKYHSLKMEEINRIAEELWKKTYRGTDIDTILIRSDNETAKGNRSYNYRVCMVKQDAEMDMRGRCSAGQKVLASIIIRLALAECFGVNCGLIALDEPTTNLDRDNINSLAEALHDIIDARRHQANFQLIVITHDEDFLKAMRCGDFCDYYWRVSRNERQKSVIERQSIAQVMYS